MPHPITGVLGLVLLLPTALLVPTVLRVRGASAYAVGVLVVAAADVVLAATVVSLFHGLTRGWLLAAEAVLAGAALAAWWLGGRPALPRRALPSRERALAAVRAHPAVVGLLGAAGVALAVELVLAVVVVPNNWDSMTYHLARGAYWLQEQSVAHFANGSTRQLANPPNGEILQTWTLSLFGTDRLANVVQWCALVGLGLTTFAGARLLGFARPASAFAAALFVTLPQPVLQATTTQNDLIVSFFVCAALLLGLRGLRDRHRGELLLAGLAVGLAVGTKGTGLMALPALALVLSAGLVTWRPPVRTVAWATGAALAGVVALGAYGYVENLRTYGEPLGNLVDRSGKRTDPWFDNALRCTWSFVDSPGVSVGWLGLGLQRTALKVFHERKGGYFTGFAMNGRVHEDFSAYGLVGLLILLPLVLISLVSPRAPPGRRVLAAAAVLFLLVFVTFKGYDPWVARLLMPMVALAAPLLAASYRYGWTRSLAVVAALVGLIPSVLMNEQKRLLLPSGAPTVLSLSPDQQRALARPEIGVVLRGLDRRVGRDSPLGLVRGTDSWDYVFFGEGLERRVVPLKPAQVTPQRVRREGLAGVVYANVARPSPEAQKLAEYYWFVPGS